MPDPTPDPSVDDYADGSGLLADAPSRAFRTSSMRVVVAGAGVVGDLRAPDPGAPGGQREGDGVPGGGSPMGPGVNVPHTVRCPWVTVGAAASGT